jgi:hypothetical protein
MNGYTVYLLVVLATTVWVYFDAGRYDWSGNGFCDTTWKWLLGCLLLWFVVFPAYLVQRRKVPARPVGGPVMTPAWENPVASSPAGVQFSAAPAAQVAAGSFGLEGHAGALADVPRQPLLTKPLNAATEQQRTRSLSMGLSVGAVVAFAGGLAWAGVVIATGYDIGFLAWFIGAGTGLAVVQFAGRPLALPARVTAGVFAVASLVVGEYVIFVHAVRVHYAAEIRLHTFSAGYVDSAQIRFFVDNFRSIVGASYFLWAALAFFAVWRSTGGKKVVPGLDPDHRP